eukprot:452966-Pyramimonas_sp.AAC.1
MLRKVRPDGSTAGWEYLWETKNPKQSKFGPGSKAPDYTDDVPVALETVRQRWKCSREGTELRPEVCFEQSLSDTWLAGTAVLRDLHTLLATRKIRKNLFA